MSKRAWIIFVVIVIILLGGLVVLSNQNKIDVSKIDPLTIQPARPASGNIADHVFGKADSKVVLIEYGDYQCPGCGSVYPTLKTLSEKYQQQIAFVFRNFPLTTLHPNALAAAATAEAAGLQGKFWQMHNQLYETQSSWEGASIDERTATFKDYASQLGLNLDTYNKDLAGNAINQKISFDQALGKKVGITGTPSIYLDGKAVSTDVWSNETKFDQAIQTELKKNNIALPTADTNK